MDKQCSVCGKLKSINDFYKSQRGSKCKECVLNVTRIYKIEKRKDKDFRLIESIKSKERRVRLWQNYLVNSTKFRNVESTISIEDINDMFEKQEGLCYWFKIPLIPSNFKKHPQQPSLDRLDRSKGYTKDNVVLSCYSANIGRNECDSETWIEFLKLLFKNF